MNDSIEACDLDALRGQIGSQEQICDTFELAWKSGAKPAIEAYLGDTPEPERTELLGELVRVEVHYRRKAGETPVPTDYSRRFPTMPYAVLSEAVGVPVSSVGAVLNGYRLKEELGQGGMGRVYCASHPRLDQDVALKVLQPGMDSKPIVARFEAERQTLARMDHPHIARVFDGGVTEDGRPFFVMELVRGVPVTRYCDEHALGLRQRMELFISICQAVQHAHQKGIIHRDLKPSNVLVAEYDGKPKAKIIDFGIARATERRATLQTQAGMLVGTPEYMSPEQADPQVQDIDTRSDVYSLGVILYELLVGETPFAARSADVQVFELLRMIREVDPPAPSQRLTSPPRQQGITNKDVRGELDWITLKCLEKDRARRYQTADALEDDIQRFLDNQPVLAGPPSRTYRLRKFVSRHRTKVIAATVLLVTLIGGIVGTTFGLIQANNESAIAKKERDEKSEALVQATQAIRQTRGALRTLTDEVIEQQMARQVKLTAQDKVFLRKIIAEHEALARLHDNSEEGRAIRAEGLFQAGYLQSRLGERTEAMTSYDTAQALFTELAENFPLNFEHRKFLARVLVNRGRMFRDMGNRIEAANLLKEALTVFDGLVREQPRSFPIRSDMAIAYNELGNILLDGRQFEEAEAEYRHALAIRVQLVAEQPGVDKAQYLLAQSHHNLGAVLRSRQMRQKAAEEYELAQDIRKKLVSDFPDDPEYRRDLAIGHQGSASLRAEMDDSSFVEVEYRAALAILTDLTREFPTVSRYRNDQAQTHGQLGVFLDRRQRYTEAEAEHRKALAVYKPLASDSPNVPEYLLGLSGACNNLGNSLRLSGKAVDALPCFQEGIDLSSKLVQQNPRQPAARRNLRNNYASRGRAHYELQRYTEAIEDWNQALALDDGTMRQLVCLQRALCYAHIEPAKAVSEVDALVNEPNSSAEMNYNGACVYAIASAHPGAVERSESYAAGALGLLNKCRELGHFKQGKRIDDLKANSAFARLREREDFRQFLVELELVVPTQPANPGVKFEEKITAPVSE